MLTRIVRRSVEIKKKIRYQRAWAKGGKGIMVQVVAEMISMRMSRYINEKPGR